MARPKSLGRQDGRQAHSAVTYHGNRRVRTHPRADGGVVAGTEDVGQREEVLQLGLGGGRCHSNEGGVRERDANVFALAAVVPGAVPVHPAPPDDVVARGEDAIAAIRAVAARPGEGRDHEVPDRDVRDGTADLRHRSHELVAHVFADGYAVDTPVRPQVGAANAGSRHTEDGVGGVDDHRIRDLLEAEVLQTVNDSGAHTSPLRIGADSIVAGRRIRCPV